MDGGHTAARNSTQQSVVHALGNLAMAFGVQDTSFLDPSSWVQGIHQVRVPALSPPFVRSIDEDDTDSWFRMVASSQQPSSFSLPAGPAMLCHKPPSASQSSLMQDFLFTLPLRA